jgi:hypothetical protein
VRITIIDAQDSSPRDYNVGSSVLVGALTIVVASELGRAGEAGAFELVTVNGDALNPEGTIGTVCRPGGIYALRSVRR